MGSEEILKAVNQFPFFIFCHPRGSKSELNKNRGGCNLMSEAGQVHSDFRVAEVVRRDEVRTPKSLNSAGYSMP